MTEFDRRLLSFAALYIVAALLVTFARCAERLPLPERVPPGAVYGCDISPKGGITVAVPSWMLSVGALYVYSAAIQSIPAPEQGQKWYRSLYVFLHLLGANFKLAGLTEKPPEAPKQ